MGEGERERCGPIGETCSCSVLGDVSDAGSREAADGPHQPLCQSFQVEAREEVQMGADERR